MTSTMTTVPLLLKTIQSELRDSGNRLVVVKKDCLVIEKYTGKTYTYYVKNFMTGERLYLFHKKQPIIDKSDSSILQKLEAFAAYGSHYPKDGESMIRFIFETVFRYYGFTIRNEQIDLSIHMYHSMLDKKISLSDVPVGLGKTHAYLVAAIVQRYFPKNHDASTQPIIITTSSIELQKAIVKDYLPEISKMLMTFGIIKKPVTTVIRKGKDNYLCDLRLKSYIKNVDPRKKRLDELIALRKVEELKEIDLDEIKGISGYDRKRICVNYNTCQVCLLKNGCRYQQFMKNVKNPDIQIQVCNHNYYLADVIRRRKGLSALLPDHKVVVMDEAHKLMDAARQMYGSSISQREIYTLAKNAMPKRSATKEQRELSHLGEELIKYQTWMFDELVNNIPKNIDYDETEKFETVLTSMGKVYLSRMIANIEAIIIKLNSEDKKYLAELRRCLKDLKVFQDWGIIYWLEKPFLKGQSIFASIPIALSKEIGFDLWRAEDAKILTSGTLAVKNDFEYIKNEIGLEVAIPSRIQQLSKASPFDYKKNCLLYIPENLPYPSHEDDNYLKEIARHIEALVKTSNGHAMVLFTSYKPLKIVYEKLKGQLVDYEVILMSKGKKDAINSFKKTKNGILFATGSAWEGVNIPGDLLSHLIIVKVPFPIPDPISEYERTMYSTLDEFIDAVVVPKMLIKLRQGVGRLIRNETDNGVISILDARASIDGKYNSQVIEALPLCKTTSSLNEIKEFYNRKKPEEFLINK